MISRLFWNRVVVSRSLVSHIENGTSLSSSCRFLSSSGNTVGNAGSSALVCIDCTQIEQHNGWVSVLFDRNTFVKQLLLNLTQFDIDRVYCNDTKVINMSKTDVKFITNSDLEQMRKRALEFYHKKVKFSRVPTAGSE